MPSLPAIPPSPSAPPSLIYFLSLLKLCTMARPENTEPAQGTPRCRISAPSSLANPTQNLTFIRTPTRRRPLHTADIHCVPPLRHAHIRRECLPFHMNVRAPKARQAPT
ncbi:hypothetical protein C8R43DRAFT_1136848 [Mycena crocata]|nr:hypothetical protein C8R43DRAFT_1136848 [Mycena crocata]